MKRLNYFYVSTILLTSYHIYCSLPGISKKTTQPSFPSCQIANIHVNKNCNPIPVSMINKNNVTAPASYLCSKTNSSSTRHKLEVNHPSGSSLFPQNSAAASALNTFLNDIAKPENNYFLVYFNKLHLLLLHELYIYLVKIYATFNLTQYDKADPLSDYLKFEATQALNKKTLIIGHIINIIEAQLNSAVLALWPGLPKIVASRAGVTLMKNDYGSLLQLLVKKRELALFKDKNVQQSISSMQSNYNTHLGHYLRLMNAYTTPLYTTKGEINLSQFVQSAKNVEKLLQNPKIPASSGATISRNAAAIKQTLAQISPTQDKQKTLNTLKNLPIDPRIRALNTVKTINPPVFFYNEETFRGIQLIPALAKSLPKNSENVPWPAKIVKDAETGAKIKNKFGNVISNEPLAFFANNKKNLFVNIPKKNQIYVQELLPQPNWLNSTKGVMLMVRGCLGDFASLLDPMFSEDDIFDPCLHCIISQAAANAGLASQNAQACSDCSKFLNSLENLIKKKSDDTGLPSPGDLPSGPPS